MREEAADMATKRSAPMSWSEYVLWVIGDDRQIDVAAKTGIDQGTISRWRKGDAQVIGARSARQFALGYGRPVLEAFVVAGFLTEVEAGIRPPNHGDLSGVSNERLAAEVKRRLLDLTGLRALPG
jgi:transcriptional regulator with XRE-family HTH domain